MLDIADLELRRGRSALLQDANLRINAGEHAALVGANGSGKTSLFKLLLGEIQPDAGRAQYPSDWRLAHMAQETGASDRAALDYVLDGHNELRRIEQAMETCTDDMELAQLHADLDAIQAWSLPSQAEKLLLGLGFKVDQLQHPVKDFSGGWRIRLNLAQTLMRPSDLMLLDEPTNHLDLDASLWLEQWLAQYRGTLLLISHDRDFIDATCDQVVHLEQNQLFRYRGNYSAFERQRAERLSQQQQMFDKQQREIAHMQKFVERFRAKATKARQAQSRVKALERMELIAPAHVDSPFNFSFGEPDRFSDPLLTLDRATLGYGELEVLKGVNLSVHPGTRLGLLGANGRGKSTLLKSLAAEIKVLKGERVRGEHLRMGYFSQHQLEQLDLDANPMLQLQRARPEAREQEIRTFLGGFDFGSRSEANIRHFSGGEKARLVLALIAWQKPNILLLDEPTNHLDLDMCHALTVALQDFPGAVVLVSHDRHLLRNSADEFILVNEGSIAPWDGDLDDYRQWLLKEAKAERSADRKAGAQKSSEEDSASKKTVRKLSAADREKLKPVQRAIRDIDKKMEKTAKRLAELEAELADTELYTEARKADLNALLQQQGQTQKEHDALEEAWLEQQEKLEALEQG